MTKNEYFLKKSKYYYDMFLQNKYVRKVSIILKYKDKFVVLVQNGKNAFLPGGSVDPNETIKDAAIRETLEETSLEIENLKYLKKMYYTVDWIYNNQTFKSKRMEFYFLTELEFFNGQIKGEEGEFDNNIELMLCSIPKLEKLNLNKAELDLIKSIK